MAVSPRPPTAAELAPIVGALNAYADIYSRYDPHGRAASTFIDGRPQNIEAAKWLLCDGPIEAFPADMLQQVAPWLTMQALVTSAGCTWVMTDDGVGVQHPLLETPIAATALNSGQWLDVWDYDEPPDAGEVALDSYDAIVALLARKHIYGAG